MKITISGVLRLATPLICASGTQSNNTTTMTAPVFNSNGRSEMVPYFPSNDVRGRLRRFAAFRVLDVLKEQGKVPVEVYSGLTCGSASTSLEGAASAGEVIRGRKDIFMGIFGGGSRLLKSQITTHDMMPLTRHVVDSGIVRVPYDDTLVIDVEQSKEILHSFFFVRNDDLTIASRIGKVESYVSVEDIDQYLLTTTDANADRKKAKEDGEKAKKTTIKNMMTYDAIAPGVPMTFQVDFPIDLTPAQVGLVMSALCDFFNTQGIGGFARNGLGQFIDDTEALQVYFGDEAPHPLFEAGGNGERYKVSAKYAEFLDAMEEELASVKASDLITYFIAPPAPKKAKGAKEEVAS